MGSRIEETCKGDYQRVMNYVEAWNPSCGVVTLKQIIDDKAEARRMAKEKGY